MTLELGPRLGNEYTDCIAQAAVWAPGNALEFGVASGRTLQMIARHKKVVGFDSFEGLPEDWREGFPKGIFAGPVPNVPNAEIVVGWFEDTLPKWVKKNQEFLSNLGLVHLDADLYSSTKIVLEALEPYLLGGTVLVFDEYHGYPGWEEHEHKAWIEFLDGSALSFEVIGHGPEQLVVRIL